MGTVVTGIAPREDPSALERALRAAGLPLQPLSVISGGHGPDHRRADSGIRFVHTGTDSVANLMSDTGLLFSMGGTEVPGVGPAPGSPEYFQRETVDEQLEDLEIPESEIANYQEAIDAGRSVMVYYARPQTVERVMAIFRDAGVANVKVF
jgi:hypothetical protein